MLALVVAVLAAAPPASGSREAAPAAAAVDVLVALCGAEAAAAGASLLDSLLFHRSTALTLHIIADRAARARLPTQLAADLPALEVRYIDAEEVGGDCAALPLSAAELLPGVERVVVLAPEAVVLADIAQLYGFFSSAFEDPTSLYAAVAEQSSWCACRSVPSQPR